MSSALYRKWTGWLRRIDEDQLKGLIIHRHIFQQFQEHTLPYAGKPQGADLFHWINRNYVAFAATTIRRMIEKPTKSWDSISLRILLEDMAANDVVLTLDHYRHFYRKSVTPKQADRDFAKIARNKKAKYLSAARIRRDIQALERACKPVKRLADKVIAHTEADRRKVGRAKYWQIEIAIDLLEATFRRYWLLINGSGLAAHVPRGSYDVVSDLKKVWP